MPLLHPAFENPDVLWPVDLGQGKFNPRTTGELKAELLDRAPFVAQEMTFASSQKKIIITAEVDEFGSKGYRAISLTLAIDIQSGIYLFKKEDFGQAPSRPCLTLNVLKSMGARSTTAIRPMSAPYT